MEDPTPDPKAPTWKLLLVKWLGLFPALLVVSYGLQWLLPDTPLWIRLLIDTAVLVPLLAYVITPRLDALFADWLYKGVDGPRTSVDAGS